MFQKNGSALETKFSIMKSKVKDKSGENKSV